MNPSSRARPAPLLPPAEASADAGKAQPLTVRTKVFYGLGSIAFGVKDNGFGIFLLIYYSQVLGLPEDRVGFAIMLALIADAVLDPFIGWASDRLHSRWGRRHPFMYMSALPVAVAYYVLWAPPAGLSHEQLFWYLLVVAVLVRCLIACYEIPSSSLAAELTDHYDVRTSMLSYRYFFGWWGGLTMAVLAYSVFLQPDATHATGVLNPEGYRRYGLVSAVIMAVAILISAAGTHAHIPRLKAPPPQRRLGLRGTLNELRETLANHDFLVLFGAAIFTSMAVGMAAVLGIYFNTFFWELSSSQMSLLAMLNFISAALAASLTPALSLRMGKKRAAIWSALGALFLGSLPIALRLFGAFPANGSPALVPTLAVVNTTLITLFIVSSILVASMVADVVEDSELTTGRRSEGVFFAANAFVQKAVSGAGIFTSTLLLRAIDFPRQAQPGTVDPTALRNLGLIYLPTLMILFLAATALLSTYRISRESHATTLERLGRGPSA